MHAVTDKVGVRLGCRKLKLLLAMLQIQLLQYRIPIVNARFRNSEAVHIVLQPLAQILVNLRLNRRQQVLVLV